MLDGLIDAYDLQDALRSIPLSAHDQFDSKMMGAIKMCIIFDFLGVVKVATVLRTKLRIGPMAGMGY